ncbi:hypothetical protein CPC08DRAFT_770948 [Agrocybe pediades]|nr:hypothetical protein CPC08DRAFT_770948 [Agrocybe pediades]
MKVNLQDDNIQSKLPVELHELIINELEGDEDTLKQCALTSKLYRHLAQERLFKDIDLEFLPHSNPAKTFLSILAKSPHIANYVKRLTMFGDVSENVTAYYVKTSMPNHIAKVFSALTNLTHLRLGVFDPENYLEMSLFPRLSPASMAVIHARCRNISHLTLENIDIPLTILTYSNSVRSLVINDVQFRHKSDDSGPEGVLFQVPFLHLKRIRLYGGNTPYPEWKSLFPSMMYSTTLGGPEALSVDMDNSFSPVPATDFEAVRGIIKNSMKSLKILDITVSTSG